jgi:hypothetical protein
MHKRLLGYAISCTLILSGCAQLPAKIISREETQTLLDDFRSRLANKYEVLSSVVFTFGSFTLSSLGLTSIDAAQDSLSAAGLSPVGITLFKVVAVRGEIQQSFIAPELAKHGDVAKAVAGNIHDIYFDLTPPLPLSMDSKDGKLYLKTSIQDGSQSEYVFSERDRTLMEKRLYRDGQLFWSIHYADWFEDAAGKLHPKSIRFIHQAYQYQLVINLKEVRPY